MNKNFEDKKAIQDLLNNYFNAVSEADVECLKTIFHENASMYGYLGEDSVIGTPEIFYADLNSKPSMKSQGTDCKHVIDSIDITDKIATASIFVDNFFGITAVKDIFHLIKINDQWKIVCKTFTTV